MNDQASNKETNNTSSITSRITLIKLKCCKISINKPLIPLKLALFFYYGAGSFMPSFTTLLFKQRGVTLSELSAMTIFAPIVQVLGTTISGVVTDKLGRSKPVLVANMLLTTSFVIGILLLPKIDHKIPDPSFIKTSCNTRDNGQIFLQAICDSMNEERNCSILCSGNDTTKFNEDGTSLSFMIPINNESYWNRTADNCFYRVDPIHYQRKNWSLCDDTSKISCVVCCSTDSELKCSEDSSSGNLYLIAYAIMYILFLTSYSNTYRCFDITVMSLAKEYGSDFGHERFFSILGNMAISPIAGIISQATTPNDGEKNYASALYFFIGIICILLVIIYHIPVVNTTPGDKMWKKSFKLLMSYDVLMFLITILTLGTSFNFTKYFIVWYLEGLNASSILIGLITSVSALYGLPFLITSKWWVKKLGTHKIFIISFMAYVACFVGYSFLKNPWLSLLLELHTSFSYYLLWVAVIEHSHYIAPEGLTSTAIAVAGGIHYSAGKSTSGLIGGMVMNKYGAIVAFRLLASICLSMAVLYTCYRILRNKYTSKMNLEDRKEVESKEEVKSQVVFTLQEKT